ncbi:hypothetical protein EC957_008479 [Mortierella hygrophila]|uniref:Uncharacterized protein n=1 Tax=Mortierella hygrophila TaxID=979708 RepID=A0A9P6EWX7_9FUNG|nr:hypothetical protein EC957_008479 [Mortierella hygrophila]
MTYNEFCTLGTIYRAINNHAPGTPVMNCCLKAKQLLQKFEPEETANAAVSTPSIGSIVDNTDYVPVPNNHHIPTYTTTIASNSSVGVTLSFASAIATVRKGRTGRPKQQNDSLKEIIYSIIKDTSDDGLLNSTHLIHNRLEQDFIIKVSIRTINRTLYDLGCYWGTGTRRHFNHDSKANVKYRHEHFRRCLANLSSCFIRDVQDQDLDNTNPCRWSYLELL